MLSGTGAEKASGTVKVSFKITNETENAVKAAIQFGEKVKEVSYNPAETIQQATEKESEAASDSGKDNSKAAADDSKDSDQDADDDSESDQQTKAADKADTTDQAAVESEDKTEKTEDMDKTANADEDKADTEDKTSDDTSDDSKSGSESKAETDKASDDSKADTEESSASDSKKTEDSGTTAATAKKSLAAVKSVATSSLKSALLAATSAQATSGFNATISSTKTEYGSGVTATYSVDYTVTPGALTPGDYIIVTVPTDVASDVDFMVGSNHFSSVENLGNGQYKLTFADDITTAISGSFTMFITTADVDETTTEPITVGNDSSSITVNPKGPTGTGVYTDTIMKDAADNDGKGNSSKVGYGDYDYSEGYGDSAAQIGVLQKLGDSIKYRIYVNDKQGTISNITVSDVLPDGMTFTTDEIEVTDRYTGEAIDKSLYTVSISGNVLTFNYPGQLTGQTLQINYWVKVDSEDALKSKYTNRADITYTENGNEYNDHRNYVLQGSNFNASNGEKSVNKTEISNDGSQYVTYTFKFWNQNGFAAGAINLTDVLDEHVKFVSASENEYFSVTNDGQNVYIKNTKAIPSSSTQYVRFIVDMSDVPEGYTVKNSVGGNTVTTTKKAKISLDAVKTVNNEEPGEDNIFEFQLLDEDGNVLQTKENSSDGKIDFDSIEYSLDDVGKTFVYTVKEVAGNDTSVTYDDAEYTVKVAVSKDDDGNIVTSKTITKDGEETDNISFNNTKAPSEVTATLDVTKALSGRDWKSSDSFKFKLAAVTDNAPIPEETTVTATSENKSPSFGDITYDEEGTYEYTITEEAGSINGVTYDTSSHKVVVKVEKDSSGKLGTTVTYDGKDSLTVTNTYKAGSTSVTLDGTKTLSGKSLKDGEFGFTLKGTGDNTSDVSETVKNNGSGKIEFSKLTYTEAGTYEYQVAEEATDESGVTIDSTIYTVTVVVTDDGSGTLKAATTIKNQDGEEADSLDFANIYKAGSTSVTLGGNKTFTGYPASASEKPVFTYTLSENGSVIDTKTTNGAGAYNFDSITYTEEGEHTYTVKETKGNASGVTYDENEYTVTVTVTDDGNGNLQTEVSGDSTDGTDLDFTNSYEAAGTSITLEGEKTLTGRTLKAGEFTFAVYEGSVKVAEGTNDADGKITFDEIKYDTAGTHTYTIKETTTDGKGVTVDTSEKTVKVSVTDDGSGTLSASVTDDSQAVSFTNTYAASGSIDLTGTKTLTGKALTDKQFTFAVYDEDGNQVATGMNDASGNITFGSINYTGTGTYKYTVKESSEDGSGITTDKTVKNVEVKVTDNGDGTLNAAVTDDSDDIAFENTYTTEPTSITLTGTKKLTGKDLENKQFKFAVYDEDGNKVADGTNDASGNIVFDEITYDKAGTYKYTVKETSEDGNGITVDTSEKSVTVKVTDNGDGTLTAAVTNSSDDIAFTNKYEAAETSVQFTGTKTLKGKNLKNGEFSFVLKNKETGKTLQTVKNDAEGGITFDKITYDEAGTYTYTISEEATEENGVTIDSNVYDVTVTVTDNGKGSLVAKITGLNKDGSGADFENTYKAGSTSIVLGGHKYIEGISGSSQVFTFNLKETTSGASYKDTQTTTGAGDYKFNSITYDKAGTYTYTVTETKGSAGGYTYDEKTYDVTVEVTDDENGHLNAEVTGAKDDGTGLDFTNTYEAKSVSVDLKAKKVLEGKTLEADQFTFDLLDESGTTIDTKKNNAAGNIAFDTIEYSKAGTYKYTVKEEIGDDSGMRYDRTTYEVTVNVTDDGNGQLSAEIVYPEGGVTFTNKYETVSVKAKKVWNDSNNQDGLREDVTLYLNKTVNGQTEQVSGQEKTIDKGATGDALKVSWTDLPKYEYDEEISYSVTEKSIDGYKTEITGDAETGYVVTNTHTAETTEISGIKVWDDNDDQDGTRPTSITVRLYADGAEKDHQKVTAEGGWAYSFNDLPKNDNGKEITYTVSEDAVSGYSTEYEGTTITNTHTPGKTSVSVIKKWSDNSDQDKIRPDSVKVQLLANGTAKGDPVELSEDNDWTYTWSELDQKANKKTIEYTVEEVDTPEGYTAKVTGDATEGYTVTNTHKVETTSVSVNKVWKDNNDQDGIRPASIRVQLLADGSACGSEVTLNKSNSWSYEWTGLNKNKAGEAIEYTVKEVSEVKGYEAAVTGSVSEGFTITNTHEASKTKVEGTKYWNDDNDKAGMRPSSITVHVYADGKTVATKKVTAEDNWKYSFTDLDEYKNGKKIVYTVTEDAVPNYQTQINGYDIINIYQNILPNDNGSIPSDSSSTTGTTTKTTTPESSLPNSPTAGNHVTTTYAKGVTPNSSLVTRTSDTRSSGTNGVNGTNGTYSSSTTRTVSAPRTGDQTNLIPFGIVIVLAGILTVVLLKRKRD